MWIVNLFLMFFATTPLLSSLGWQGNYSLIFMFFIFFIIGVKNKISTNNRTMILSFSILITSSITSIYWLDFRYIFSNIFFVFSLIAYKTLKGREIDLIIDYASAFLLIIVAGAIVGFFLALFGLSPKGLIINPDGRNNYYYYTTFTNTVYGNFIRPSGIYDEPGTLSFYLCALAAIRSIYQKNKLMTWTILIMGLVTFSIAHLIYLLCHFIKDFPKNFFKQILIIITLITFSYFIAEYSKKDDVFNQLIVSRLQISEHTMTIAGDNRSFRMIESIDYIVNNPTILLSGIDPTCRFDKEICEQLYNPFGENPLMPITTSGIFVSWPYYIILMILILSPLLGRQYYVTFGFGLLLLQRPYALDMAGASISIALSLCIISAIKNHFVIESSKPSSNAA